ncbi:hypothetical protein DXA98_00450 [Lachnospiraceae bacterium OF09-6]|nr:hypothetical protein DXA98_00450 [Lachnospiraceae bacterium OF09-6]
MTFVHVTHTECLSDDRNQGGTTDHTASSLFGMELFYYIGKIPMFLSYGSSRMKFKKKEKKNER